MFMSTFICSRLTTSAANEDAFLQEFQVILKHFHEKNVSSMKEDKDAIQICNHTIACYPPQNS